MISTLALVAVAVTQTRRAQRLQQELAALRSPAPGAAPGPAPTGTEPSDYSDWEQAVPPHDS
jgi:hypothetical protein